MTVFYSTVAINRRRAVIEQYLERRQLYPFQVATEPSDDLRLSVVIPCFDETDVGTTLASLSDCDPPGGDVEVLVVVNAPDGADRGVLNNNADALFQVADHAQRVRLDWLQFHALEHNRLPPRFAGVGLARKIGMDEAAARIARSRRRDGLIVSLDADCTVAGDFLVRIDEEFRRFAECPGLSINFEHRISRGGGDPLSEAMLNYELHLRYNVAGQRWAGFPYAFHTIGSAMACRGSVYAQQGGMNRRQAGEDFYFIQKLIALGGYRSLNSTTVYPQVRVSDRVPFGTGRSMRDALDDPETQRTFAPEIFRDLRRFCETAFEATPEYSEKITEDLSEPMSKYLESVDFAGRLSEIERNVSSPAMFRKRIFRWFNAFRLLKYAQFASRHYYPKIPIVRAATELAGFAGYLREGEYLQADELLFRYRQLDRESPARDFGKDLI